MLTLTRRTLDGLLAAAKTATKILDPAAVFVQIYLDGPTVTPPNTVADFTLPPAADLPAQAVGAWSGTHYYDDGRSGMDGPALTFRVPDATKAVTAKGWLLTTAAVGGQVLAWAPFAQNVDLGDEFHPVTVIVRVTIDPTAKWDASVILSGQ